MSVEVSMKIEMRAVAQRASVRTDIKGSSFHRENSTGPAVFPQGFRFTITARNDLGERAVASPAISNGQIFIRTDDHVFCIGAS